MLKPLSDGLVPPAVQYETSLQGRLSTLPPPVFVVIWEQLSVDRRIETIQAQTNYWHSRLALLLPGSRRPSPSRLPPKPELQPPRFHWRYLTGLGRPWGRHWSRHSHTQSWRLKLKQLPPCRVPQSRIA